MNPLARNRPRQRRPTIFITHDGKTRSINEWVRATGIAYRTIWDRYHRGIRDGAELLRSKKNEPREKNQTREPRVQVNDTKALNDANRAAERKRLNVSKERKERMRAHRERIEAEYLAAMLAPLIDRALLTDAERVANWERVRYSGQRSWRMKGESL